jgi:hypothetical protein
MDACQYFDIFSGVVLSTSATIALGMTISEVTFLPLTLENDKAVAFLSPE